MGNEAETKKTHYDSPEACREAGKALYFGSGDAESKKEGYRLIVKAAKANDNEARYIMGKLLVTGALKLPHADSMEQGRLFLFLAALGGYSEARALLNQCCMKSYEDTVASQYADANADGPLRDFDGNPFTIHRTGIRTPIDAVLEYTDGKNIFTLSVNLDIVNQNEAEDAEKLRQAVQDGIMEWQGEYTVFGGQKVEIKINVSFEHRFYDNITIMLMTNKMQKAVMKTSGKISTRKGGEKLEEFLASERSATTTGMTKWTVSSRKNIILQSEDGRFDDYEDIKHTVKHEFGHALGLGDLYADEGLGLPGVPKGTYPELDAYCVAKDIYNLVMYSHRGLISNNDMEMVLLAFRDNCKQNYQKRRNKGEISQALGRGN
jgi:hypothetical protein